MKKLFKIIVALTAVALVLVVIASVLLRVFLPPEKAKALVVKQLTTLLKRDVQLGPVAVGLFSGLDVSDLKISESPDFAHGTFLSTDHFSIRLALWPLLHRKVVVNEIVLKHPIVTIVRHADGKTFNFSDLMSSTGTAKQTLASWKPPSPPPSPTRGEGEETARASLKLPLPNVGEGGGEGGLVSAAFAEVSSPSPSPSKTLPFLVSHAQIQNGILHFIDRSPAKQSVDIDPLNLKLKNVSLTAPFSVQTYLKAKAKGVTAELDFAGQADLETGSVKIKNCVLSSGGSTLTVVGRAEHLKAGHPDVDLKVDVKEFKLSTLTPFVALPPALKVAGPVLGNVRIKGTDQQMDFSSLMDMGKAQIVYGNTFVKPPQVPMGLTLQGVLSKMENVKVREFKAILGSLQVTGHGAVQQVTDPLPQLNFHLATNAFPIMELAGFAHMNLPSDVKIQGNAQASLDLSGTQESFHFATKADGQALTVVMANQFNKASGVPLNVSLIGDAVHMQRIKLDTLKGNLSGIALEGSASYDGSSQTPKMSADIHTNTWSLEDLARMVPLLNPYKPSGQVTVNVKASGTADNPLAHGSINLVNVAARYEQSELSQINTDLTFTQQDVNIPKLTGKLNGSDLALSLVGRLLRTQPDINVTMTLGSLDLNKIVSISPTRGEGIFSIPLLGIVGVAYAAPPPSSSANLLPMKVAGHVTIGSIQHQYYNAQKLDMKWNLSDVTPDLGRVNGTATLRQGPGKVQNLEKLANLSKTVRLALLPLVTLQKLDKLGILKGIGLPSFQSIDFDNIQGDYVFRTGLMDIKTFHLVGNDLDVDTKGTIGLAGTQPLDLRVVTKLAKGLIGGTLGQIMRDESGRPTLIFVAKGTVSNPQVRLDMRDIGRKAVQQAGQELLKGVLGGQKSSGNSPGEQLLKGILGGQPKSPPSNENAPDSANPPPANAGEDLQKVFKNIFK